MPDTNETTAALPLWFATLPSVKPATSPATSAAPAVTHTLRVPVSDEAVPGLGFNSAMLLLRSRALTTGSTPDTAQGVSYSIDYVSSQEQLARSMGLSVRASCSGGVGSGGASLELFRQSQFTARTVYVLARMTVVTGGESLVADRLVDTARTRLRSDPAGFYETYGDGYITHVVRGVEVFALLRFTATTRSEFERVKVAVRAGSSFASGKASWENAMSRLTEDTTVHIQYVQRGGGFDGVVVLSPAELIARLRALPDNAVAHAAHATNLYADVSDYGRVTNLPGKLPEWHKVAWAMEDLAGVRLGVERWRQLAQDVLESPRLYAHPDQVAAVGIRSYVAMLSRELERLQPLLPAAIGGRSPVDLRVPSLKAWDEARANQTGAPPALTCPVLLPTEQVLNCLLSGHAFEPELSSARFQEGEFQAGACNQHHDTCFGRTISVTFPEPFDEPPMVGAWHVPNGPPDRFALGDVATFRDRFTARLYRTDNLGDHGHSASPLIRWFACVR